MVGHHISGLVINSKRTVGGNTVETGEVKDLMAGVPPLHRECMDHHTTPFWLWTLGPSPTGLQPRGGSRVQKVSKATGRGKGKAAPKTPRRQKG